ncbi:MAG: hypothetical protein V1778_05330 [bacterium]
MSKHIVLAALLLLLFSSSAFALNDAPESNNAIGWFPCAWQFGSATYGNMNTTVTHQGYDFDYKKDSNLSSSPQCRPQKLIDFIEKGVGLLILDTHGSAAALLVATYKKDESGLQNWTDDFNELTGAYGLNGLTECQAWVESDAYKIYFMDLWVSKYSGYHALNRSGLVYTACCDSWFLSPRWGSYATLSYPAHVTNGRIGTESYIIFRHLDGYDGTSVACRTLVNAVAGCDTIRHEGGGHWVLAPTVVSWEPSAGRMYHDAGPFTVSLEFDTRMRANDPNDIIRVTDGYVIQNGEIPYVNGPQWLDDHTITANVVPLTCPARVYAYADAKKAVSNTGGHQLDGGIISLGIGRGPNRDDFDWEFYTDASQAECDNWAASFASCGAFPENGSTTVYWQVEFQHGSIGYDVLSGNGRDLTKCATIAAAIIDENRPAAYFVELAGTDDTVFEIVEHDQAGKETRSRPFMVSAKPENFATIMSVGNDYPPDLQLTMRPPYRGQPICGNGGSRTERPWYIFVSSKPEFLLACQPVIDKFASMGRPAATLLTTNDPNDIWIALEPYG